MPPTAQIDTKRFPERSSAILITEEGLLAWQSPLPALCEGHLPKGDLRPKFQEENLRA